MVHALILLREEYDIFLNGLMLVLSYRLSIHLNRL